MLFLNFFHLLISESQIYMIDGEILQAEYEEGDDIGTLRCGHGYHVDCVKKWLLKKDSCPLCKAAVLNI